MISDRAGERDGLDVTAERHEVLRAHVELDARHLLLDDGSLVEVFRDVVRGRADQLDAAFVRLVIGARALERRQQAVVDVDRTAGEALARGLNERFSN